MADNMHHIQIHVDMRRNEYICNPFCKDISKFSDRNYITSGKLSA